jgi:hypothetical protein
MATYMVVVRNPNSWVRTDAGDIHEITAQCGHRHRSVDAAEKCLHRQMYGHNKSATCRYRHDHSFHMAMWHNADIEDVRTGQSAYASGTRV